ncbi:MAG TPA: orotidine-5'-phosphate decarboxylase [Candidatus Acidoferrales bacterium]|nr:orotidine-5'-phosphate decarboxylase [Candidatus Acidoferrales bacterium]
MASGLELLRSPQSMRERLIVALDVDGLDRAKALVRLLAGQVGMFKVGKQLFTHAGPAVVRLIHDLGGEVFLDLKFHDIPNTVAKAAVEATRLGVKMFNVHASGSLEMMRCAVKEVARVCRRENLRRPIMLAVTVLTSLSQKDLERVGVMGGVMDQVVRLALLSKEAGMDGVVASPQEVADIRAACGRRFVIVSPGIRPHNGKLDDQKRVMTPREAMRAGADYIVVGRYVLEAKDPVTVVHEIVADMSGARMS